MTAGTGRIFTNSKVEITDKDISLHLRKHTIESCVLMTDEASGSAKISRGSEGSSRTYAKLLDCTINQGNGGNEFWGTTAKTRGIAGNPDFTPLAESEWRLLLVGPPSVWMLANFIGDLCCLQAGGGGREANP